MANSKITQSPQEQLNNYLQAYKAAMADAGYPDVNVSKGSKPYIWALNNINLLQPLGANIDYIGEAVMPDTTTGDELKRWLAIRGLEVRGAAQASGQIRVAVAVPSQIIPTGQQLQGANGILYAVSEGGAFSNGDVITVHSVSPGANTNLGLGEFLEFKDVVAFVEKKAVVSLAISGGSDPEDEDQARDRLLANLRNGAAAGNPQQLAEFAEAADPAVQRAYVYCCDRGASTTAIACTAFPSANAKTRQLNAFKMSSIVVPYITQNVFLGANYLVTTVEDLPVDICLRLNIPLARAAGGNGNGWMDAVPFPQVDGATQFYAPVLNVIPRYIVVKSLPNSAAFQPGSTRVQWIDKTDKAGWKIRTSKITADSFEDSLNPGTYYLELETPFPGVAIGDHISAASVNAQVYLDAVLKFFANLGPGERNNDARSKRQPRPQDSNPYEIDASLLKAVQDSADEVNTADFWYRKTGTPAQVATPTKLTPPLPATTTSPPLIFIPRNISFIASNPLD